MFADDVSLFNETTKQMEKRLNSLSSESLKVDLKIQKGKTKYMTSHADSEDVLMDQQKIEKVTEIKHYIYKRRNICQDQSSVELFW